jgi:tetratricopeptide (TPR) repeat protein
LEPSDRLETASTMNNLGYILMQRDKPADAETMLREAVAMHGRLPDNEYVERSLAWNNLAKVFQLEGKLAEAESTHREALAVKRKLLGNESGNVVDSLNLLADLLQQQGRVAEARPLAEEAVAILRRHPDQEEFFPLYQPLRHVLTALGDTPSIEALSAQLLQRLRKSAQGGDATSLNDLAWFLATCPDSKFRDGTNAIACAEKAVGAINRKNINYLDTLAAAYAEAGQFAKAISVVKEALALPHSAGDEPGLTSRLKLYESNSPYRETD